MTAAFGEGDIMGLVPVVGSIIVASMGFLSQGEGVAQAVAWDVLSWLCKITQRRLSWWQ